MNINLPVDLSSLLGVVLIVMASALVLTILFLIWILWRIKRIELPFNAGFVTALRATPLSVVIVLDLLDLSLDIFSAPITWILLGRLGLTPLRTIAVIKDLIPFDGMIPAMTIAWVLVRAIDRYHLQRQPDYRLRG
jgi:hypothetical protein